MILSSARMSIAFLTQGNSHVNMIQIGAKLDYHTQYQGTLFLFLPCLCPLPLNILISCDFKSCLIYFLEVYLKLKIFLVSNVQIQPTYSLFLTAQNSRIHFYYY